MTRTIARMYKTAQLVEATETFVVGEFVAVQYLNGTTNKRFRCTLGDRVEVLPEYYLSRFTL